MILHLFTDYMYETWIKDGAQFPRERWSVFTKSIRTNNDVEGWHGGFNRTTNKIAIQMYELIEILEKEANAVERDMRLVSQGKLCRYQKKTFRDCQRKIFKLWDRYSEEPDFNAMHLLTECSRVKVTSLEAN